MQKPTLRDKSILVGLYLAKFDDIGLQSLGFASFTEAFNVIGFALGVAPRSIKNYRDEFDPLFPNKRRGWHKRQTREYCKNIYDAFQTLDLVEFTSMIKNLVYKNYDLDLLTEEVEKVGSENDSTFAKRLITGQAAEQYFRDCFDEIDLFLGRKLYDTTKFGCGFDFKLVREQDNEYFGVEVKGLTEKSGRISLTNKEFEVARILEDRYFLFVVKNFRENPFHQVHRNPVKALDFSKTEQRITQVFWSTSL